MKMEFYDNLQIKLYDMEELKLITFDTWFNNLLEVSSDIDKYRLPES
jgi:hypothetical protein